MLAKHVVIVGQTGSGKSALAMSLAQRYPAEIIATDSRTVYKGLDIGTAKPSQDDRSLVPHHMIDIADWSEPINVAQFKKLASEAVSDIAGRSKLPVIVGGTGLYVNALVYDFDFYGKPGGDELALRAELEKLSVQELQEGLRQAGIKLPENRLNKRYLIRSLEVGADQQPQTSWDLPAGTLMVGLSLPKEVLSQRLSKRIQIMLDEGLLDEVAEAHKRYPAGSEALKGNAYRALKPYLDGATDLESAKQELLRLDLKLAKRQLTWHKRDPNINWFSDPDQAHKFIDNFLSE